MVRWSGPKRMGKERFKQKAKRDSEGRINCSALWPWFGIYLAQSGYTPTLFPGAGPALHGHTHCGMWAGERNLEILY